MRRLLSALACFALGVLLAAAALEAGLRLLPVSKGLHRSTEFDRWPLPYAQPGVRWDYSIGWQMRNAHSGRANNYGHLAPFDYRRGSNPVIVLGDSYVESMMNDADESLQARLGQRLGQPEGVYGLGVSGASASSYVALGRMARDEFAPVAAVVALTDGDLSESLQAGAGSHYLRRAGGGFDLHFEPLRGVPLSTRIRNVIGDISLHRYLQINLQFSPSDIVKVLRSTGDPAPGPAPAGPDRLADQRAVADWFLDNLPAQLGLPPRCIVLLFDGDRYGMYKASMASTPKDEPAARAHLLAAAQQRGFRAADLMPVFRDHFQRTREKLDHWPIDRHWNDVGHRVAAEVAHDLLTRDDGAAAGPACLAGRAKAP